MYLMKCGQKSNHIDGLSHWKFFCYSKIVKAIPFKFFREEALFSRLFEPKSMPLPYCRSGSRIHRCKSLSHRQLRISFTSASMRRSFPSESICP